MKRMGLQIGLLGVGMLVAGHASADTPAATGGGTVVLNSYSKVWVSGDDKGPGRLGKNTGAGTMDASFAWDSVAWAADKSKVNLLTMYTRSDADPTILGSHMQGGFALATLTDKGVTFSQEVALPRLNGERTFMRPIGGFTKKHAVIIAASEDNGASPNPQPVMFVIDKTTGQIVPIPNSTRGEGGLPPTGLPGGIGEGGPVKPTNLIQQGLRDGLAIPNPQNQRGPHTIQQVDDHTFVVGMQYNNQAQEAFSVTVNDDASVKMNWFSRYSNVAQHCRPQVAIEPDAKTGFIAAVEANNQPAEIGFRVTEFDVATGKALNSRIVVRSKPSENKYVSEPVLGIIGDKLAITYGLSAKVRDGLIGGVLNGVGHAGGMKVDAAILVDKRTLEVVGEPVVGVGQYGRHGSSFVTGWGPNAEPALAVISGSSTGTGGGFIQMYPLKADGTLGVKDAAKVYQVSAYSDVANVQARGKRNPQDQARGFINGIGNVPNPGYTTDPEKAKTSFMPEVKQFSVATVTGYSGPEAVSAGLKNSVWLSLVPAGWDPSITTIPGKATDKPGTNEDGTGPLPRTNVPGTDPRGEAGSLGDVIGDESTHARRGSRPTAEADGCAMAAPRAPTPWASLLGVALACAATILRRKRA